MLDGWPKSLSQPSYHCRVCCHPPHPAFKPSLPFTGYPSLRVSTPTIPPPTPTPPPSPLHRTRTYILFGPSPPPPPPSLSLSHPHPSPDVKPPTHRRGVTAGGGWLGVWQQQPVVGRSGQPVLRPSPFKAGPRAIRQVEAGREKGGGRGGRGGVT